MKQDRMKKDPVPGQIQYIQPSVAAPVSPVLNGSRYPDRIPDTYDVAERARLAVNGLTGPTNPLADHELYWWADFDRNPVTMLHDWNDWCQLKFMEALPLLRIATGSDINAQVDDTWRQVILRCIGPDGLFYMPLEGRPWAKKSVCWTSGVARADGSITTIDDPTVTQLAHPYACGRAISVMIVYYLQDGESLWLETIRRMVDRLNELVIHIKVPKHGESDVYPYAYFPALTFEPHARYKPHGPLAAPPLHITGGEINSRLPEALGQYYRLTGYEPARLLGEALVRFTRFHMNYFAPDGAFLADRHFHAHTIYLLSMLELAMATDNREVIEFVQKSYQWAKSPASSACDLTGFFPELAASDHICCETCEIADMITIALRLSECGYDYYNDAERWARNHFAESQMTECQWIYDQAERQPHKPVADNETAYQVPERNLGAFAGWSGGNEWWAAHGGIQHCCTGNAARTLYRLWHDVLHWEAGVLRVNMLLNRAARQVDIYSFIPYAGQVEIKIKEDCHTLLVHSPAWVETGSQEVTCWRISSSGDEIDPVVFHWEGRYLNLGPIKGGMTVRVTFPLGERIENVVMGASDYSLLLRGDTVVSIDPPGTIAPLYQREHYRSGEIPWREIERWVPGDYFRY